MANLRKWAIQTLIVSVAIGWFIFYGDPLVAWVKTTFNLPVESAQLYALCAVFVIVAAELVGMLLTSGMKGKKE